MTLQDEVWTVVRRDGVIARREGPDLARALDAMAGRGALVAVLPGVYARPEACESFDTKVRAALLRDRDAVLTGSTAARLTFWPSLSAPSVEAAVRWQRPPQRGFTFERRTIPAELVVEDGRLRTTDPALTALDLCAAHGGDGIDQALRTRATTLRRLHEAFDLTGGRRGNLDRRRLLIDSRHEPWSAAGRRCHRILRSLRLPRWRANHPVRLRGRLHHLDVAFPGLKIVIEIDGRLHHVDKAVFESDRERQNVLVLEGWLVLRFTWQMIEDQPEEVLAAVREAVAAREAGRAVARRRR